MAKLVLKNNYFEFNGKVKQQMSRTTTVYLSSRLLALAALWTDFGVSFYNLRSLIRLFGIVT